MHSTTPSPRSLPLWRAALALNAVAAAVGLTIKFADTATTADPQFPTVFGRLTNELCYFTIQSNLIVIVVCAALAWKPHAWRWISGVPRLVGLICITVTGVVYYALLAGDQHLVGVALVGDLLAHLVSPVLYVATWVLGPHGQLRRRHIGLMLVYPVAWIALTLIRGAIIHIYPYDFIDVQANGYASVVVTVIALLGAASALAAGAVGFDRWRAAGSVDGSVRALHASLS